MEKLHTLAALEEEKSEEMLLRIIPQSNKERGHRWREGISGKVVVENTKMLNLEEKKATAYIREAVMKVKRIASRKKE